MLQLPNLGGVTKLWVSCGVIYSLRLGCKETQHPFPQTIAILSLSLKAAIGPLSSLISNPERELAEVPRCAHHCMSWPFHRVHPPKPVPRELSTSALPSVSQPTPSQLTLLGRSCPGFHGNLEPRTISRGMSVTQTKPGPHQPTGKTSVENPPHPRERRELVSMEEEQRKTIAGTREADLREMR